MESNVTSAVNDVCHISTFLTTGNGINLCLNAENIQLNI